MWLKVLQLLYGPLLDKVESVGHREEADQDRNSPGIISDVHNAIETFGEFVSVIQVATPENDNR